MQPLAVDGEAIPGGRWGIAAPGAFIAGIGPKSGSPGLATAWSEHLYGCIVRKDRLGSQDMATDGISQRFRQDGRLPDPVGQSRTARIEALTLEDPALAIEGQMIGMFAHQNMGQEARTGPP